MKQNDGRGKRVKVKRAEGTLSVTRANVAGIDLGSVEHYVACPPRDGQANVKTFGTTTPELVALADWLQTEGVVSVAMESTGVYWIPLYELLEQRGLEVVLVDARQLKHVPGRKTDMIDCQWLQLLHSCGLLRGAFRPADAFCHLRALVRQKATLVDDQATWLNRMQKSLDQMNVRVHRAVSDISGITGMAMIRAIVAGERDPRQLAGLRDERCFRSLREMVEELTGHWREDHLFNLKEALAMYDCILARIASYEEEIQRVLKELVCQARPGTGTRNVQGQQEEADADTRPRTLAPGAVWRLRGGSDQHRRHQHHDRRGGLERTGPGLERLPDGTALRLLREAQPQAGHLGRQAHSQTPEGNGLHARERGPAHGRGRPA